MSSKQSDDLEVRKLGNKYFRSFVREHAEMWLGPILGFVSAFFFYGTCNAGLIGSAIVGFISAIWFSWIIGQTLATNELKGGKHAIHRAFGLLIVYVVVYLVAAQLYSANLCTQNADDQTSNVTETNTPQAGSAVASVTPALTPTLGLETQAEEFVQLYFDHVADSNFDAAWAMLNPNLQISLEESKWYKYWSENSFTVSSLESRLNRNVVWLTLGIQATNKTNLGTIDYPDANFCIEYNGLSGEWRIRDLYFTAHNCW